MKLYASIVKTLKENIRDWKVLLLVLVFSPFFILVMNLYYGGIPTTFRLGILNSDTGRQSIELINGIKSTKGQDNSNLFSLNYLSNPDQLYEKVKQKDIDIGIIIPEGYSKSLTDKASGKATNSAVVEFYGSMGNARYTVAAVLASDAVYKQGMDIARITLPSSINETFLEKKQLFNEFEGYVPGLISLAVLMILFTATAAIVKENDKRTLLRIKLSRLGAFNFLSGISIIQALVATAAVAVSYITAMGLGYKPIGGLGSILIVGVISSFSMVAISLILASFLNTVFEVLTIGNFPFFILMFFSGSMFPLPKMNIFTLGGHSFGITDILPLSHTSTAFNKILNYGSGVRGVAFEIFMITILTIVYFVLGMLLYQKRKLSKA